LIDVGSRVGDYDIIARLKSGGMATLFLGRRSGASGFSRHVAIKVVHPHLGRDSTFVRMFVDEAKLSARINHPNVVHVEGLGEEDGTHYLVMEYVHGCSLSDMLRALGRLERRLSPDLAVWIAMKVLDGLHAAHELRDEKGEFLNVVHRDVSPQNILIAQSGNVKLIDFGIAKARGRQQQTATGALKGKLRYMAPEQAYGKQLDRRADIYALGIVLWESLTMQRVFKADNDLAMLDEVRNPRIPRPGTYSSDVSHGLDQAVMLALAPDLAERPATALLLRRKLAEACPKAASLDVSHMAEVVQAVLGEELEARKQALPESLTGLSRDIPMAHEPTRRSRAPRERSAVMAEMTASAPGSTYYADAGDDFGDDTGPIEAAPPGSTKAERPSNRPGARLDTTPATPVTSTGGMSRDRKIALSAVAVALVAMGAAGFALVKLTGPDDAPPADVATPLPPGPLAQPPLTETPDEDAGIAEDMVFDDPDELPAAVSGSEAPRMLRGMRRSMMAMRPPPMDMDGMSLVDGVPIFDDDDF